MMTTTTTANKRVYAPFIKSQIRSASVMTDVLIAAVAPTVWSVYVFGARSLMIIAISAAFAAASDYCFKRYIYKDKSGFDFSSLVTGVLIAFAMPVSVPLWLPAFASVFAIVVAKQAFGGAGHNLFNPAASGVCASYLLFGKYMTIFTKPFASLPVFAMAVPGSILDEARVGTALDLMKQGTVNTSAIGDYFYGLAPGAIGEVSTALLIVAFIYLVSRRTAGLGSSFGYIMTVLVLTFFTAYADSEPVDFAKMQIFSGSIVLVAVFLLNDYPTTPSTNAGKIAFGVLCGGITVAIRYFGMTYYGEYFALLICNMLVPLIEKATYPRVYGSFIRRARND